MFRPKQFIDVIQNQNTLQMISTKGQYRSHKTVFLPLPF